MKISRLIVASLFILGAAGMASANTILDPSVVIRKGGNSPRIGPVFSFLSPTGTNDLAHHNGFVFKNVSNVTFNTLSFTIAASAVPANGLVTCQAQAFYTGCKVYNMGSSYFIQFFGGSIPKLNGDFNVDVTGWNINTTFNGAANVPEPATMSLLLIGSGILALKRKLRSA